MSRFELRTWRRAVSLLELLAVCVIVLAISAAALRSIIPAMQNRQLREAARTVNVFINGARNRAIQTGRPAGVWIDRFPGLAECAVSLSYAQVPDPYGGDFNNSGVEAFIYPDPNSGTAASSPKYCLNVVVPSMPMPGSSMQQLNNMRGADVWTNPQGPNQRFVRQGDLIRINYQNQFRLFTDGGAFSVPGGPYWIIAVGVNQGYLISGATRVTPSGPFNNNTWGNRRFALSWFNDLNEVVQPYITLGSSSSTYGRPVPYQIYRQPVKSAAESITLPEGTVIDLNYSGDQYRPFHPRNVASNPYIGNAVQPNDTTPIIITFNPSGTVEQLYCRYFNASNSGATAGEWAWRGDKAWTVLYLLIGQREKVPCDPTLTIQAQMGNNWSDNKNLWVAIYPLSGLIFSAPVAVNAVPVATVSSGLAGARSYAATPALSNGIMDGVMGGK